ncbi:MAG: type II toxin-antitoxin system RelE/ParE family toxin [Candidatus Jettenia sp.]|nr:MAG: type II toxin-antitoxin system RelE/ParE family toxin [Candidatus Jettenia sp.]
MNKYSVTILPKAIDELSKIDKPMAKRITDKLAWFSKNIEVVELLPLRSELSGLYKLKVGAYRVIYELDQSKRVVIVHKIGHRRDIYK